MADATHALVFSDPVDSTRRIEISIINLADGTQTPPFYYAEFSKSKPHVRISRAVPNQQPMALNLATAPPNMIAEITYHSLSSKIDVSMSGSNIIMKRKDSLSTAHHFDIVPLSGRWKEDLSLSGDLKLVLEDGPQIARYVKNFKSTTLKDKTGAIKLFGTPDQAALDAIVISGLAVATYRSRSDKMTGGVVEEVVGGVFGF